MRYPIVRVSHVSLPVIAGAALFAALAAPVSHASAQAQVDSAPNGESCDSPQYRKRVAVFLTTAMVAPRDQPVPPSVANLLQVIASRADTILHVAPGVLPQGEPAYTDSDIGQSVFVTWQRGGRVSWRVENDSIGGKPNPHAAGARLIAQSLEAARAADELFMIWPDSDSRDSIQFRVGFVRPTVDGAGSIVPIREQFAIPIFSVDARMETSVAVLEAPKLVYPRWSQGGRASGRVVVRFVVDTSGRAEVATFQDIWPADKPRLTGQPALYYSEMLQAVKDALPAARYRPATIGGCSVRQTVVQQFAFTMP